MKCFTLPASAVRETGRLDVSFWLLVTAKIEELGLDATKTEDIYSAMTEIQKDADARIAEAERVKREAEEIFARASQAKADIAIIKGVQNFRHDLRK